nr:hypothetical protein [Tanacetum cinerariifolium]
MGLEMRSSCPVPTSRDEPVDVSDPDPLYFADSQSLPTADVAQSSKGATAAGDPESKNTSFTSMLRLRFEQEAKLLKKSVAQVARRDKRIQARENEIKNLETLLEAKTDMKKTAEVKNAELGKELDSGTVFRSPSEQRPSVSAGVHSPSSAIAGRRWVIRHGLLLAVMKCGESTKLRQVFTDVVSAEIAKGMSEGLKYGAEHEKANLSLEAIEVYDPEAEAKYIETLHALKDLMYPMVDQLESLKDAPIDVIMASSYMESDTGDDAPQWICELHPSSSQLNILVYLEVRDPTDPWACKEEILLANAIAANISRAEKKKKCRVVCRTYRSAPRIMPDPMVFQCPCQPLLHKVSISCWWMRLQKQRHPRTGPLLGYLGLAPYMPCITETSRSTACEFTLVVSYVLCGSLRARTQRLGYIEIKDSESAAARIATRLCGKPSIGIFGL